MAQITGEPITGVPAMDAPPADTTMMAPLRDWPGTNNTTDMRPSRLLGFVPISSADTLQSALASVAGPAVAVKHGENIAVLLQAEPPAPLIRRGRKAMLESLQTVQRRLEVACQAGAFLPMDPAAACCPTGIIPRLIDASWSELEDALDRHGQRHQWDVILRWSPESVVSRQRSAIAERAAPGGKAALAEAVAGVLREERARREMALLAALKSEVLAVSAVSGTETELSVTVLVPSDGEAVVETALSGLSPELFVDTNVDMRGPLPPVSFFAVRVAKIGQGEVSRAWRRLELPERIDASSLHWHWRLRAASAHPDRQPIALASAAGAEVAEITDAYRLLRDLLPRVIAPTDGSTTLPQLLQRAGHRLIVPAFGKELVDEAPTLEAAQ